MKLGGLTCKGGKKQYVVTEQPGRNFFVDKRVAQKIVAKQNEQMGFVPDPDATAERAQASVAERLKVKGIRPEENVSSCGIVAAR